MKINMVDYFGWIYENNKPYKHVSNGFYLVWGPEATIRWGERNQFVGTNLAYP